MSDDDILESIDDGIEFNDKISESRVLLFHWNRILEKSAADLTKIDERNKLKSALLGLDAFLSHYSIDDKEYLHEMKELRSKPLGGCAQDEIIKLMTHMSILSRAMYRSPLVEKGSRKITAVED